MYMLMYVRACMYVFTHCITISVLFSTQHVRTYERTYVRTTLKINRKCYTEFDEETYSGRGRGQRCTEVCVPPKPGSQRQCHHSVHTPHTGTSSQSKACVFVGLPVAVFPS